MKTLHEFGTAKKRTEGRRQKAEGAAMRAAQALDYVLRFCVSTKRSGRVEMLYFQNPKDFDGVKILLSPRERDDLVLALSGAGFHSIVRDDEPERQMELRMAESGYRKEGSAR